MQIFALSATKNNTKLITEKLFPNSKITFLNSLNSLFSKTSSNKKNSALLPIENSSIGIFRQVFDKLNSSNLYINDIISFQEKESPNLLNKLIRTTPPSENTKFALLSKILSPTPTERTIISITPTVKDQPGLLLKILYPFQENNLNIHNITSYTSPDSTTFYLEFEGDIRQARTRKIITYLEKDLQLCTIKHLGGSTSSPHIIYNN